MLISDPHLYLFLFLIFATSRAYSFFFFFLLLLKTLPFFFLVSALWHTPLTQTVYSAPTGMGKVTPRSLFLCLWPSPSSICLVSPPSCLRACACARLSAHPRPPVCVLHGDTGTRCRTRARLAEQDSDAAFACNATWPTDTCLSLHGTLSEWRDGLCSSRPTACPVGRVKKGPRRLFWWNLTWVCSVHVWMLWLFCKS